MLMARLWYAFGRITVSLQYAFGTITVCLWYAYGMLIECLGFPSLQLQPAYDMFKYIVLTCRDMLDKGGHPMRDSTNESSRSSRQSLVGNTEEV